jgi:hypothetical protein
MNDAEFNRNRKRREKLVRRICKAMGWEYKTAHVWTGIRKVALAEAVPVGLDKLEAIVERLEGKPDVQA